jgi:hypothetical protein
MALTENYKPEVGQIYRTSVFSPMRGKFVHIVDFDAVNNYYYIGFTGNQSNWSQARVKGSLGVHATSIKQTLADHSAKLVR